MTNIESLVFEILTKKPKTRFSDRKLMLEVWKLEGFTMPPGLVSKWLRCSLPESIRRTRQKVFKERPWLKPPESQPELFFKQEQHRKYYSPNKKISAKTMSKWKKVRKMLKGE